MSEIKETVEQAAERHDLIGREVLLVHVDGRKAVRVIQSLEAENAKLRAEAESFQMGYRMKCDEEIKALHVAIAKLRAERDVAREVADDCEPTWMGDRCASCGHRLRLRASACPICRTPMCAPWHEPKVFPETCDCKRCDEARAKHRQQAEEGE